MYTVFFYLNEWTKNDCQKNSAFIFYYLYILIRKLQYLFLNITFGRVYSKTLIYIFQINDQTENFKIRSIL